MQWNKKKIKSSAQATGAIMEEVSATQSNKAHNWDPGRKQLCLLGQKKPGWMGGPWRIGWLTSDLEQEEEHGVHARKPPNHQTLTFFLLTHCIASNNYLKQHK